MTKADQNSLLAIGNQELEELMGRIIDSSSFGKSAVHANLLRFLVASTVSGTVPKEATVATHLFGSEKSYQDTSQVRVHIYHLRKKLEQYFSNEGKQETYLLTIPKGRYEVEMTRRSLRSHVRWSKGKTSKVILLSALSISILLNLYYVLIRDRAQPPIGTNRFWEDFVTDDQPTLVVLGDLLIFSERNQRTGEVRAVRIADINEASQLEAYKDSVSQDSLVIGDLSYTYLIKSSVAWIESLTRVFYARKEFSTRVLSRMDTEDLHDYNIIFIGMQKTAGIFNGYFADSDLALENEGRTAYLLSENGQQVRYGPMGDPDQEHKDYGLIAKYPGPNNNTIFMFGGIWDTATSQAIKAFTDEGESTKMAALMVDKFGRVPMYFEVLIEVEGVDRVGFETEVIHMRELSY